MPSIKVILNPVAGKGYGARIEPELRRLLDAQQLKYDLERTAGRWHAAELAQRSAELGFDMIVAAGGDGTYHEVANGLMAARATSGQPIMGCVPVGSGSDFAHAVGVPGDLEGACRTLAHGRSRLVDLGRVTVSGRPPRYFDNAVGIGFDGVVTLEALKFRHLRGMALYLPVVLKTVFVSFKAPRVTIEYDGQSLSMSALMITVCNGPREGGGFYVAPGARPDDGVFDLCIAAEVSRMGMLQLIPHFMKGTHVGREPVTMARARRLSISSPDPLIAHVDGEVLCTDGRQIECEILPSVLRVQSGYPAQV